MGKFAYSTPQSEISGTILAVKMEQKISQELNNISLSNPVFNGDSEIVLRMIARNDLANLPIFYGTRIMQISALKNADSWFWCPGILNPADLLTRSGSNWRKLDPGSVCRVASSLLQNLAGRPNRVHPSSPTKLRLQQSARFLANRSIL